MTTTGTNAPANGPAQIVAGDPAVKQLFADSKAQLLSDLQTAQSAVDKVIDSAISGEPLDLEDAEKAAVSVVMDFVPPGVRGDVGALVQNLASTEEAKVNPVITATAAKGLNTAKAWIDSLAGSLEKAV